MIILRVIKCFPKYFYHEIRRYLNNGKYCCEYIEIHDILYINDAISAAIQTQKDNNENHIVWFDMEMTGLETENCHILEIACLITNEYLTPVSDCLNIVIHQSDDILETMSDWCKIHHQKTGLIDDCRLSKITLQQAEEKTLQYLNTYIPKKMCPLAGNSIYMDRIFLKKYMPLINNYLHYRNIDVSTIKELTRRWQPSIDRAVPKKQHSHRAMFDLQDSLNELRYYREHFFAGKK